MTTLQEASTKALDALRKAMQGNLDFDVALEAFEALRTALAQHREQQPVCHGCGIPAGDVHMSICKSGKWPSRVSNGDTAVPAPQPTPKGEPVMFAWKRGDGTYHDASGTEHSCGMHPLFAHAEPVLAAALVQQDDSLQAKYLKSELAHTLAQQAATKNCPQPEICGSKECEFCRDTAAPAPQAQQGEHVAWAIYDKRGGSKSLHWAEQHTDGNAEMYNAVPLYKAAPEPQAQEPAPQPAQGGDYANAFSDGWEAAMKSNASALQSAQPKQEPLTDEAIYSIVRDKLKCFPLPYDIRLARAIEASHGITGMVEAATRPAIDAASKQGGQHE